MIAPTSSAASIIASALPKAQSRASRNCCWISSLPARSASAQQIGDDELAGRGYEDQDAPGYDPGMPVERHPPEGVPPARPEVLGRLLQPDVELLEGRRAAGS